MAKPAGGPKPKSTSGWDNDWIIITLLFGFFIFLNLKWQKKNKKINEFIKRIIKEKGLKKYGMIKKINYY